MKNKPYYIAFFKFVFLYAPLYFISAAFRSKKSVWLVSERKNDARDNGFYFYEYAANLKSEVYYVINKKSDDFSRLSHKDQIIQWGSVKHYWYFINSAYLISSGFDMCCPDNYLYAFVRRFLRPKGKIIFLQHGITKDYMKSVVKEKLNASLLCCGAKPEFDFISSKFGYDNGEVQYLGFCRFDGLTPLTDGEHLILFMPTWRTWIKETDFLTSNYYLGIQSFLLDKNLELFLEETNSKIVYFIHPAIRAFKGKINIKSPNIIISNNSDNDLQVLLRKCRVLITDFSSVYFDVAYMGKPVIYYHFDYEEYRSKQYSEGYFDYSQDGFGPIAKDSSSLVSELIKLERNNWCNSPEYLSRSNRFFEIRDFCNCKRTYEAILGLEKYNE